MNLTLKDIDDILSNVLFEFPLTEIRIDMPKWVQSLDDDHWLIEHIFQSVKGFTEDISRVRDVYKIKDVLRGVGICRKANHI